MTRANPFPRAMRFRQDVGAVTALSEIYAPTPCYRGWRHVEPAGRREGGTGVNVDLTRRARGICNIAGPAGGSRVPQLSDSTRPSLSSTPRQKIRCPRVDDRGGHASPAWSVNRSALAIGRPALSGCAGDGRPGPISDKNVIPVKGIVDFTISSGTVSQTRKPSTEPRPSWRANLPVSRRTPCIEPRIGSAGASPSSVHRDHRLLRQSRKSESRRIDLEPHLP